FHAVAPVESTAPTQRQYRVLGDLGLEVELIVSKLNVPMTPERLYQTESKAVFGASIEDGLSQALYSH
ncbi:hypothetical protein, partial [Salmonella enterica]|uniref:hypothetical protein n=1 Tax=Salmonella enterica TaxID=28901 RepID=UPI003075B34A